LADLYAVRIFGCTGTTSMTVDAIEWALQNNMQVINMSLGSDFGIEDSADVEVTENASGAGIIVVTAVGSMA
jgi:minor extracellular serine protease Vpr